VVAASPPNWKFVAQKPITVPRSPRWNQVAIVPTLEGQPVAWASPLTAIRTVKSSTASVKPKAALARADSAIPESTMARGPKRAPSTPVENCPTAYATR
jgi:hypothetical protein